ncbi:MAG TPA: aldehyde dehydrogenase family protein [Coleofasciculaceae cyanobacterium]
MKISELKFKVSEDGGGQITYYEYLEAIADLRLGMPWEDGMMITPLLKAKKTAYFQELVDDATHHGASAANTGGGTVNASFSHPAGVYSVTPAIRLYSEEQFGPVIPVVPYDDTETPIDYIIHLDSDASCRSIN